MTRDNVFRGAAALGGGGGGGFTPADLPGISDFGQGSGITPEDGFGVPSWPGELGVISEVQTTNAKKPALAAGASAGGNDVVRFDGTDDFLDTALTGGIWPGTLTQPNVIAVRWKSAVNTGTRYVWDGIGASNRHLLLLLATDLRWGAGTNRDIAQARDLLWHSSIITYDGVSGIHELDGSTIDTGNIGANTLTGLTLGAINGGASSFFQGDQAAGGVVDGTVTGDALTDLRGWLDDQ